jgi:hypothetical protein
MQSRKRWLSTLNEWVLLIAALIHSVDTILNWIK